MKKRYSIGLIFLLSLIGNGQNKIDAKWWPRKCGTIDALEDSLKIKYKCKDNWYTAVQMKRDYYHGILQSWDKNGYLRVKIEYCMDEFCGKVEAWDSLGNIIDDRTYKKGTPIGHHRMYYSANRPKRFINFNDEGKKDGWEVFWYDNGNVKDSTFFESGDITKGTTFYYNGKPSLVENEIDGKSLVSATSYNPKGKKTGQVKNGNGTIFVCDSVGTDCKELAFKNGKRVFRKK